MVFAKWVFLVYLPLSIGGMLYLIGRPGSVRAFAKLGIGPQVHIPQWYVNNIPDGLWLFALLNCVDLIWAQQGKTEKYIWVVLVYLLAILSELLQKVQIIPGTYDPLDILSYTLAGIASVGGMYCIRIFNKTIPLCM